MNNIQAVYDILDKNWSVSLNLASSLKNELAISFIAGTGLAKAKFNNLRFGYDLKLNNEIIVSDHFPRQGQIYELSDSYPLEIAILDLTPNKTYELCLYAENANHRTEKNIEFLVPLPGRPHNSWTWDNGTMEWLAPIPEPKDFPHEWDESVQLWIKRIMPM